jgi:hypothetical protein
MTDKYYAVMMNDNEKISVAGSRVLIEDDTLTIFRAVLSGDETVAAVFKHGSWEAIWEYAPLVLIEESPEQAQQRKNLQAAAGDERKHKGAIND